MGTINLKNVKHLPQGDLNSYFGNVTKKLYHFEVNSSGITVSPASDLATAVQAGDVIRLGILKSGATLLGVDAIISDASAGSITGKLGFQYVDGVDVTAVPQDDDFWFAATTLASTGILIKTNVAPPVTIPKDAYLILTSAGAAHSATCVIDFIVSTIETGA